MGQDQAAVESGAREAYLEILKSADVSKINRGIPSQSAGIRDHAGISGGGSQGAASHGGLGSKQTTTPRKGSGAQKRPHLGKAAGENRA